MSLHTYELVQKAASQHSAANNNKTQAVEDKKFFENGSTPGFADLVDTVNPLQHVPVVGSIYREATGDTIAPAAKIAGGFLVGGIFGAVAAIADCIFEQATGQTVGDTIVSSFTDNEAQQKEQQNQQLANSEQLKDEINAAKPAPEDIHDIVDLSEASEELLAAHKSNPSAAAVAVPPNPFLQAAAAQAAQTTQATTNALTRAALIEQELSAAAEISASELLWQKLERLYAESSALDVLYNKIDHEKTLA